MSSEVEPEADAVPEEILAEGSAGTPEPEPSDAADVEAMALDGVAVDPDAELAATADAIAAAALPTGASAMEPEQLRHLVEALIFASDKPVTVARLRQLTRISDVGRIHQALAELGDHYSDRGLSLQQVSGGYQFRTNTQYSGWVQQLIAGRPVRLSRAQLETLAIVAYRQPITRPEIDDIRGVDSSATLRLLLERALIRVLGKREEVGRPMLYGTTKEFLDFFSLGDLRELPTLREYSELTAESRQVVLDRLGDATNERDDGAGAESAVAAVAAVAALDAMPEPAIEQLPEIVPLDEPAPDDVG